LLIAGAHLIERVIGLLIDVHIWGLLRCTGVRARRGFDLPQAGLALGKSNACACMQTPSVARTAIHARCFAIAGSFPNRIDG
jgi:hypothetical protein